MRITPVVGCLAALASLAAGAVPARGEAAPPGLQVRHQIQPQEQAFLIGAVGIARLPDGALLKLELIPLDETGEAGDALRVGRASVKGGRFELPPWTVPRGEIRARQYRLEVSVAGSQPLAVDRQVSRLARRWRASDELVLGDARAFCKQLTPLALAMRTRWVALSRHRAELTKFALGAIEGTRGRADWKAWAHHKAFARDRADCLRVLDNPLTRAILPATRRKAHALLANYDMVVSGISSFLQDGAKSDAASEFAADFKSSDFATAKDDLLGLDALLAAEGALLLVNALGDLVKPLDPGAATRPPDAAVAAARKAMAELLETARAFYEIAWTGNVQDVQKSVLDAIDTARRLAEASAAKPTPEEAAANRKERTALWTALNGTLDALGNTLRARVR